MWVTRKQIEKKKGGRGDPEDLNSETNRLEKKWARVQQRCLSHKKGGIEVLEVRKEKIQPGPINECADRPGENQFV